MRTLFEMPMELVDLEDGMHLTNIRSLGRYKMPDGRCVNVYKGRVVHRSVDVMYFLRRGSRVPISDAEFFAEWKPVETAGR